MRVSTKRYISKRTGKTKIYRYVYGDNGYRESYIRTVGEKGGKHTLTRGKEKNIVWRGRVTKYGQKWLKEYKKGLDFSDANYLEARLLSMERHKRSVSSTTMESILKDSKIDRFIYNMGGDTESLSKNLEVSERDILNEKYWHFDNGDGTFTYNGVTYLFTFDYSNHSMSWRVL